MACDYAINPLLLDAGLALPKDVLIAHRFCGMSAERIYSLIEEQLDQDSASGERENDPRKKRMNWIFLRGCSDLECLKGFISGRLRNYARQSRLIAT